MKKITGIIYKYISPSGKVYIGQTINERKRRKKYLTALGYKWRYKNDESSTTIESTSNDGSK